jgi:hypothetical protein
MQHSGPSQSELARGPRCNKASVSTGAAQPVWAGDGGAHGGLREQGVMWEWLGESHTMHRCVGWGKEWLRAHSLVLADKSVALLQLQALLSPWAARFGQSCPTMYLALSQTLGHRKEKTEVHVGRWRRGASADPHGQSNHVRGFRLASQGPPRLGFDLAEGPCC